MLATMLRSMRPRLAVAAAATGPVGPVFSSARRSIAAAAAAAADDAAPRVALVQGASRGEKYGLGRDKSA